MTDLEKMEISDIERRLKEIESKHGVTHQNHVLICKLLYEVRLQKNANKNSEMMINSGEVYERYKKVLRQPEWCITYTYSKSGEIEPIPDPFYRMVVETVKRESNEVIQEYIRLKKTFKECVKDIPYS